MTQESLERRGKQWFSSGERRECILCGATATMFGIFVPGDEDLRKCGLKTIYHPVMYWAICSECVEHHFDEILSAVEKQALCIISESARANLN
jgi:hypothetical protein